MANYSFKVVNNVVITTLSQINSDVDIYKIFGDALRKNRSDEHPYKTGVALKLAIKIDCPVLPKVVQVIDIAMYKHNIKLYIVFNKKVRPAKIEHLYQMIKGKVVTLDIRDNARRKYNIVMAKKCLRTITELESRIPVKEASTYNGDFMAPCDISEATDVMIREYASVYYHGNVLNIVCDMKKVTKKQRARYRAMNPIVVFNMTQDDIPAVKEAVKSVYGIKYRDEDATTYQRYFSRFFKLDGLEITEEIIMYMIDTLTKMCQDYVELASDSAFEFINSFVNINLRYEDYLEINSVLHLPGIVDFVVSNMIQERDVEVESFYEDRKDDDYESINSSYLGEDK